MNTSLPVPGRTMANVISCEAIGIVESVYTSVADKMDYLSESQIVLRPELTTALSGIEYFSHLWVIYHQHRSQEWRRHHGWELDACALHPPSDDRAGQGVFSSRAPVRPARLGSCIVRLLRREGARLVVRGLDAISGTPVVDVKVYVARFDSFPEATVPLHWAKVLSETDDLSQGSRVFHWETTQVDFAIGFRLGLLALERMATHRGQRLTAELVGSLFFAQGWEASTGCSPLRGTLDWVERCIDQPPWQARLARGLDFVELRVRRLDWPDAQTVMSAEEGEVVG